jgi:hypothetical protein
MAISGVRSVPKTTNSATTLKCSPAQCVNACAICSRALYSVRHILKSVPNGSAPVFIPKMAPPVGIGGHLDVIGNIQNKLFKELYGKGSPTNSATSGHALR